ncbi:23S rRNA (adenine(2503)-C(2))-methyltransferase RlmN [bacterium]|jgi:23S rRNA (adenine2503-C2)-methyltransferase|nr:23S rRNA (adenine(2503)-C(2))-methyltransferase RlmN [bacterium]NBX72269.1 23S rRNA (adenine(2503)-C(2))-methyltransferase RlmN [bacterium]
MSAEETRQHILGMTQEALEQFFVQHHEKPFRGRQILQWMHQRFVPSFDEMTDLSKKLRLFIAEHFYYPSVEILRDQRSDDGTRKWLLKTSTGSAVEVVYIPEETRATLCVSSQVGCELNCQFCYTATQGFERNLSAHEIVSQLWFVNKTLTEENALLPEHLHSQLVTNVVFMGMGEPLRNLDSVIPAVQVMMNDYAYGLSKRRVTISTSGVVPGLERLAQETDVALALSLHAPDDQTRSQIIPLNKKYPLDVLLPAVVDYLDAHDRKMHVTLEYVMLNGVNDSEKHAYTLAKLVNRYFPGRAKVNLIPFNPFPTTKFESTSMEQIKKFAEIVRSKNNIITTVRKTRGQDILGACGQLAGDVLDKTRRRQQYLQKIQSINAAAS